MNLMIHQLSGQVASIGENFFVLETGGIGFKVFSAKRMLGKLLVGKELKIFSHLHGREDGLDLYGFPTEEELKFFELLISVSGVGPKSALSVLDVAGLKELTSAIKESRPDLLTRASGIGRKTAERIIVELRTRVQAEKSEAVVKRMESDADLLETLVGLGYRREQAKAALEKIDHAVTNFEERLKAALKNLSLK